MRTVYLILGKADDPLDPVPPNGYDELWCTLSVYKALPYAKKNATKVWELHGQEIPDDLDPYLVWNYEWTPPAKPHAHRFSSTACYMLYEIWSRFRETKSMVVGGLPEPPVVIVWNMHKRYDEWFHKAPDVMYWIGVLREAGITVLTDPTSYLCQPSRYVEEVKRLQEEKDVPTHDDK